MEAVSLYSPVNFISLVLGQKGRASTHIFYDPSGTQNICSFMYLYKSSSQTNLILSSLSKSCTACGSNLGVNFIYKLGTFFWGKKFRSQSSFYWNAQLSFSPRCRGIPSRETVTPIFQLSGENLSVIWLRQRAWGGY